MLISEGVGRAHHDGTMETAGARALAARLCTNTLGISMQVASRRGGVCNSLLLRSASTARLIKEEAAGVALKVIVYRDGYFVPTPSSSKCQSVREEPRISSRHINSGTTAAPACKYASSERRGACLSPVKGDPDEAVLILPVLLTPPAQRIKTEHNQVFSFRALASGLRQVHSPHN